MFAYVGGGNLLLSISLTGWSQKLFVSSMHFTSPPSCHNVSCAVMLPLFLSITGIILVVAQRSLVVVCLVLKTGSAILGSLLLNMSFVLKLANLASIDMALASFLIQAIYGILYLLLFFLPLKICLPICRVYRHLRGID